MSVTIYHNPRCNKSRQTLQLLRDRGIEPHIVEYLDTPPDANTLDGFLTKLGMEPRELMRRKEAPYKVLELADPSLDRQVSSTATRSPSAGRRNRCWRFCEDTGTSGIPPIQPSPNRGEGL
jgi:arsenate reductase